MVPGIPTCPLGGGGLGVKNNVDYINIHGIGSPGEASGVCPTAIAMSSYDTLTRAHLFAMR